MTDRYFSLVLHSHIPYVLDHGSWPHGMDWLYEAAAESYLPLLEVFERLAAEGISPQVNIGFTPVLAAQLTTPEFASGFEAYLAMRLEAAEADRARFAKTRDPLLPLASYWADWYRSRLEAFAGTFGRDIIGAFRSLQDRDHLEVLTSAATHGYFPLLGRDESIRHQVEQGRHVYRNLFGREARGFWLPECAYRPGYAWKPPFGQVPAVDRSGVDEILKEKGVEYFFVDGHLLKGGAAAGIYLDRFPALRRLWEASRKEPSPAGDPGRDPYAPYLAFPSRLAFFARDEVSGSQVWSRDMGYPGDPAYLEFHKKRFPGGLRYWRITSGEADLGLKQPYIPEAARSRLEEHASHFASVVESALGNREKGVVAALYDTELFGHWWFEGPEWLYLTLRRLARSPVRPLRAGACLEAIGPRGVVSLPEGSWGTGGYHWIWLNDDTSWIWKRIYRIEGEAAAVERLAVPPDPRLLRQFYREKFLLESSDWPFLVSTFGARDYAENRAAEHYARALELAGWLRDGGLPGDAAAARLEVFEREDALFREVVRPDGTVI